MLLSHQHKFIYLKTHKTGSTSAELALEPFCAPPGHKVYPNRAAPLITEYGIVGARAPGPAVLSARRKDPDFFWHHMGARKVAEKIGEECFHAYRRIACVRNPFRRLLSQYLYKSVWLAGARAPETLAEARAGFRAYLFADPYDRSDMERVKRDNYLAFIGDKMILTDYLRLENLQADLTVFLTSAGVKDPQVRLEHERNNAGKKRDWKLLDFFDSQDLVDRTLEIDGWIFDLAGYSKDPADA
ncbi:sulfotransferase family protein (plasmid) [Leisingera caerulea]|uniref:Sulfotransferase family protein n=1 Tax=Leisingera caerulea TaxID=506591 RepID=A0A9Q9HL02_LEICA|nr:sulfotransferase family protein [Leisingera caerulea]UWQ56508.1 sulfotransferase family protein [Leisingera caerulea]UWQ61060.1 sulfotransferase family protein [Leisingera caerulea]UWQ64741.1 sulfotransferase family protein [Leisingera caerulea]